MKFRKAITLVAALCAVLFIGGTALAANNITTNVTSESIQLDSTCSKAGGFSLRFDRGTLLTAGDRIEIKLPLGVTICTAGGFDLELSNGNSVPFTVADLANLQDGQPTPVFFTEDPAGGTDGTIVGGVYFRITGAEGGQFMFLDVIGAAPGDFIQVGPDAGDTFTILFFDQKTNAVEYFGTPPGIYVDDILTPGLQYTEDATLAQNTLCINVSDPSFTATVVNASMDSAADKFTFVPSNPQIADIVNPQTILQYICKGDRPVFIPIADRVDQALCHSAFDIDDPFGLCPNEDGFEVILRNASTPFGIDNYVVSMEILVNGNTGANGVYWSSEAPYVESFPEAIDACGALADDVMLVVDGVVGPGDTTTGYTNSAGEYLLAADLGSDDSCDVPVKARAVKLTTETSTLDLEVNRRALKFDIPSMVYDLDDINAGDVVTVRITLSLPPCKIVATVDVVVGTFGCGISPTATILTFPYYTQLQGSGWWNGMAISNLSDTNGTFTATIYEADGDRGTFTGDINARSQWVSLLSGVTPTQTAGGGVLGDSTCYIIVTTNFSADGFAMISNMLNSAVDGSESMGYIPRVND